MDFIAFLRRLDTSDQNLKETLENLVTIDRRTQVTQGCPPRGAKGALTNLLFGFMPNKPRPWGEVLSGMKPVS